MRRSLEFLLLLHIPVFAVAGFWPFNFLPSNRVEPLAGRPGLRFKEPGIACAALALPPPSGSEFTVEILLEPAEDLKGGVPSILSLWNGTLPENLMLGQWRSELVVRTAILAPERRGRYRESGASAVLRKGETHLLTVAAGGSGTSFYFDGRFLQRDARYRPDPGVFQGQIVLGNSIQGRSAWSGTIYGVGLLSRALFAREVEQRWQAWARRNEEQLAAAPGLAGLYLFDGDLSRRVRDLSPGRRDLQIPERFVPLERSILTLPTLHSLVRHPNVTDWIVNITGFVPFGFLLFSLLGVRRPGRPWSNAALVVITGTLVSLSIETVQVLLPLRDSSATDVLTNTSGTAIGVALQLWITRSGIARLRFDRT